MYYVKKPIPVKAYQLLPENSDFLLENKWVNEIYWADGTVSHAFIDTLEGRMRSNLGDYVVEGVHGEHWSVKKDIFESTYEPVK